MNITCPKCGEIVVSIQITLTYIPYYVPYKSFHQSMGRKIMNDHALIKDSLPNILCPSCEGVDRRRLV